jgi:arylsulfatase A-like enzyme
MLRVYGYNTYCAGKWRSMPAQDTGPEGPFDQWPTGDMMSFDRFYGFLGGDSMTSVIKSLLDSHCAIVLVENCAA